MKNNVNEPKIGKRIKELRTKFSLSQSELADDVGVTQSTISKIEKTDTISIDLLIKIANHFKVYIDYLYYGKDDYYTINLLNQYISLQYDKVKIGNNEYEIPALKINEAYICYLLQSIEINKLNFIPSEKKSILLNDLIKDFYNNEHNKKSNIITLYPLTANSLIPADDKLSWNQSDLIREIKNDLTKLLSKSNDENKKNNTKKEAVKN